MADSRTNISAKSVIFLMILVAVLGFLIFAATRRITEITFEGNKNCSNETMEEYLFETKFDRNPFVFWFRSKFQEHRTIPFVEEYEVEIKSFSSIEVTVYEKSIIGYLKYMGECMYFDKDGIVVEVANTELEGVVQVCGIDFDHIVIHTRIPVEDQATFDTILDVTQLIANYQIPVQYIDIDKDLQILLHVGKVRVDLGKDDEKLSEKINDLSGIVKVLEDTEGVLDMKEYSTNDKGYTFKKD